jgi:3',5'-cyclic AMP phosphodiesterase CpdA
MKQSWTRRQFVGAALSSSGVAAVSRLPLAWAEDKQTPQEEAPKRVRIALISDTHTTRGVKEEQPKHKARFERVIAAVNAFVPDWVLHGGDLTEGSRSEEIDDFKEQIGGLKAPLDWVYGNHDVGAKRVEGMKSGLSQERLERIETALGASFWEKSRAGLRVVGINTSLFNSGLARENEQWEFLEKALSPGGSRTVLLLHYPPFIKQMDEAEDPYWNIAPQPRARLLDLVTKGDVKAMLSGHLHRPLSLQSGGVPLVVGMPVSFGLPRDKQPVGWTEIILEPDGKLTKEWRTVEG